MTIFRDWVFTGVVKFKMRSLRWALFQGDWSSCESRNLEAGMHRGGTPCENEVRDWGEVSASQGGPRIAHNYQKPGKRRGTKSLLQPSEGNNLLTLRSWTSGLPNCKTNNFSC